MGFNALYSLTRIDGLPRALQRCTKLPFSLVGFNAKKVGCESFLKTTIVHRHIEPTFQRKKIMFVTKLGGKRFSITLA